MDEIKPCPFCGSKVEMDVIYILSLEGDYEEFVIECKNEGCIQPSTGYYTNEESCKKMWNRRVVVKNDATE